MHERYDPDSREIFQAMTPDEAIQSLDGEKIFIDEALQAYERFIGTIEGATMRAMARVGRIPMPLVEAWAKNPKTNRLFTLWMIRHCGIPLFSDAETVGCRSHIPDGSVAEDDPPPVVIPDAYNDCEGPTLRSLMTRSRGRLRAPYLDWESAYRQIVWAPALSYEDFMAMVDRPLSSVQESDYGNYYHLGDYEIFQQRDGRVFLTVIEAMASDVLDYLRRYPIKNDGTYSGPEPDESTAALVEQYLAARPLVANLNDWIVAEINRTWINRHEPREMVEQLEQRILGSKNFGGG